MIALDTNIVLRACVEEAQADVKTRRQAGIARALLASGEELFVPLTVTLELEWVLRACYGCRAADVVKLLGGLADSEGVVMDHAHAVQSALESYSRGVDFADALHLALSATCRELATFDREFVKKAAQLRLKPPVSAPAA